MERLRRRKWQPAIVGDTDKWYTGYQHGGDSKLLLEEPHKMQMLDLTPCGMSRGRSAGNFEFKDKDDFTYTMSMSGTYALLAALAAGLAVKSEEVYAGWRIPCVQTKQGSNYFIEVFYIDNDL